jgi:ferric-dicitrate binding protein FerR (iron transport regulator)
MVAARSPADAHRTATPEASRPARRRSRAKRRRRAGLVLLLAGVAVIAWLDEGRGKAPRWLGG